MIEKPGAEIRRRLERMKPPRSQGWLALRLGVSRSYVSQLVKARRPIGPELAIKLAQELGEEPEFWAHLQADFDVAKARREMAERGVKQTA